MLSLLFSQASGDCHLIPGHVPARLSCALGRCNACSPRGHRTGTASAGVRSPVLLGRHRETLGPTSVPLTGGPSYKSAEGPLTQLVFSEAVCSVTRLGLPLSLGTCLLSSTPFPLTQESLLLPHTHSVASSACPRGLQRDSKEGALLVGIAG